MRKAIHTCKLSAALFTSSEKLENPKTQVREEKKNTDTEVHSSSSQEMDCKEPQPREWTEAQRLWPKGTEGSAGCPRAPPPTPVEPLKTC